MAEPLVTYELEGEVALLGLNRNDVRNAINDPLVEALREGILRAIDEARAGVIFSTGEEHLRAGLDLRMVIERAKNPPPRVRRRSVMHATLDLVARDSIPWVSALKGATVGGGFEIAAATHIRSPHHREPAAREAVAAHLSRTRDMAHDDGMFAESLLGPNVRVGQNARRIEAFLTGRAKPIECPTVMSSEA